jgi:hypothetical protein
MTPAPWFRRLAGVAILMLPLSLQAQDAAAPPAAGGFVKEFGTMWTFEAPPLAYWKATYDFAPDQAWLDHVRLASVRLPGCSASFVSGQGLVMTNHHCARACISAVSPADTNYQESGFVAKNIAEEKKCAGLYVDQLQSMEDVTARLASLEGDALAAASAGIQKACADAPDVTCQVVPLYNGGRYSLYKYRRFGDVRLVMAPEEAISFFGGDPDNFTYPRYDLDLTLLRVYQNDRPSAPKDFLRWSASGAADGEAVFIIGNPGSTGRLLTMAQMEYLRDVQYPDQLAQLDRQVAALREVSKAGPEARRANENAIFSALNARKAITGYRTGLLDSTIMARKAKFERDFRGRIEADAALKAKYGSAWTDIAAAQKERTGIATEARWHTFGNSTLLGVAGLLARLPAQAALPDSARLPQYRGQGLANARAQLEADIPVNPALEKLLLAAHLEAAAAELPATDPYLRALLAGRTPEAAAAALVDGTKLRDKAVRVALLKGGARAVAASKDPMMVVARAILPIVDPLAMRIARQNATISSNAARIGQATYAAYGTALPPDATFTLRITDGVVKGFPYNGTVAPYKTSFYGMFAHAAEFDHKPPYRLPDRWMAKRGAINMETPLDFVSTTDIIGGNSGSPVINRNAEVVGLVFDGNIEMLPNRFIFTDEVARSVSVHSEAIVEALRSVYEAGWIADELEGTAR